MVDIDVFAGAGGLAVGLRQAGFSPTQFFEMDKHSCATLQHNSTSRESTISGPVYDIDVQDIDWTCFKSSVRLLAAGTPCQPFSLAGKHLAENDGRNLFPEVIRAIRKLRPSAILLENVKGLLRDSFRPYFEYILRQLECPSVKPKKRELWNDHDRRIWRHQCSVGYEPEYQVKWRLLDAADFGVPQLRQRVFIVATRSDLPTYSFPSTTHSRSALLRSQQSGEYWDRHGIPRSGVLAINGTLFDSEDDKLPWTTVREAFEGLPESATDERKAWMNHWTIPGARLYRGHMGSSLDLPSKTIKAGVHGVPGGENTLVEYNGNVRYFTLRETARLQTFPDTHFFEGARMHVTRQIGNAVPCHLATAVARPLYDFVSDKSHRV